jgi:hypothetical protein
MAWIVMHDGQEVSLAYPQAQDLTPHRVAHNLSMINRYTGSAYRPYSVAEHSLLVADILEQHFMVCPHGVMAGLFHDGHEAVTNDQSTPSKQEIGPGWQIFEERFADLLRKSLGLQTAYARYAREIACADRMALAIERPQLLPMNQPDGQPSTPWPSLARVQPLPGYDLRTKERERAPWHHWRDQFLLRFVSLHAQRESTPFAHDHIMQGATCV